EGVQLPRSGKLIEGSTGHRNRRPQDSSARRVTIRGEREDAAGIELVGNVPQGTRSGGKRAAVERINLELVVRDPVEQQRSTVGGGALPVHRSAPTPPRPRDDRYLLDGPAVVGSVLAETPRIEHVQDTGLPSADEKTGTGDQQRARTREIRITVIHRQPVARGEPVHKAQAMGRVELEQALAEIIDPVISHAAVAIAGEYVDV